MALKKFKAHPMYNKSGKMIMAKSVKEHLDLKAKGYGHTKPKKQNGKG